MKRNNIILAALITGIVLLGFVFTWHKPANNAETDTITKITASSNATRSEAEKITKRNSLRRQINANQAAINRATNQGQINRLEEKNKKLRNKLNNLK